VREVERARKKERPILQEKRKVSRGRDGMGGGRRRRKTDTLKTRGAARRKGRHRLTLVPFTVSRRKERKAGGKGERVKGRVKRAESRCEWSRGYKGDLGRLLTCTPDTQAKAGASSALEGWTERETCASERGFWKTGYDKPTAQ